MQIALLRKDLRGWLISHAVDEDSAQAVLLACSEAVANAIEHGYRDDPFGQVEVVATVSPDAVEIQVADHGAWRAASDRRGPRPRPAADPAGDGPGAVRPRAPAPR